MVLAIGNISTNGIDSGRCAWYDGHVMIMEVWHEKESGDCERMYSGGVLFGVPFVFALQVCQVRGGGEEAFVRKCGLPECDMKGTARAKKRRRQNGNGSECCHLLGCVISKT